MICQVEVSESALINMDNLYWDDVKLYKTRFKTSLQMVSQTFEYIPNVNIVFQKLSKSFDYYSGLEFSALKNDMFLTLFLMLHLLVFST